MNCQDYTRDISALVGLTLTDVRATDDEIVFTVSDGREARLYHEQDCCECVCVDDVNGEWADLIGTPILVADERVSRDPIPDEHNVPESFTWTFYTLRTVKGSVDVRWYGASNGYYSESVDFIMPIVASKDTDK